MDWANPTSLKRPTSRKKRANFGKSTSEPNLLGHFTPRFPDNLTHLLHEYVTVDELKFYRKRRPPNIGDEFHSKDSICLYDESRPITPFSALKTEYTKQFGKTYSPRSRSVPNKFDLNATTKELLEALRDDLNDFTSIRSKRETSAKISGEVKIQSVNGGGDSDKKQPQEKAEPATVADQEKKDSSNKSNEDPAKENQRQPRVFKVQGEFRYVPDFSSGSGEFHGHLERAESMSNIKFHGKFHGSPEYRDSFKNYNHFAKSAPIKASDHLRVSPVCVNSAAISPSLASSSLSEYTDKYKEIDLRTVDCRKLSKQMSNVAMRNNLMIGHSDAHIFPEYFESFKDPLIKKRPDKGRPHSPILSLNGKMDYNPEYRVKFAELPRQRPIVQRPESHFDFFDRPRKQSPVQQHAIVTPKFNPNIAIVEPSKHNIHQPPITTVAAIAEPPLTINKNPSYLCQPEVRKARHEVLIKKRPPSPHQTISATIRNIGRPAKLNEDEENKCYNERSNIVTTTVKPPIQVLIDNFDDPSEKPIELFPLRTPLKVTGRRASSMQSSNYNYNPNAYAKRNHSKIIEGNHEYTKKRTSLLSSTTDDEMGNGYGGGGAAGGINTRKLVSSHSMENPSFVVLNDRLRQNKWMKSTWYL